ncbi:MAG: carbohydrate binding family 9 domain-containing protein, partial [Vicinamibacterales bacterium]|nr:carbohydrate binding family 9 domain-containing protein [Vicinamibacterales bacterium]
MTRARRWTHGLLGLAWLVAAPRVTATDGLVPPAPTVTAERLGEDERIVLDGVLAEPVWRRSRPAEAFLQREPTEGATPSQATAVHVAYDADALYLGVALLDSEPESVIAYQRQRDADLSSDDRFVWVIDTVRDGRTAYYFEINPAGLMGDGLLRTTSGLNRAWDGLWEARVLRGDHGWSAEVRIPFGTINFDPRLDAWGINIQRTVRRHNEELLWSGHRRNEGLTSLVHAVRLEGLAGVSQGLGLEARPYMAASWRQASSTAAGDPAW